MLELLPELDPGIKRQWLLGAEEVLELLEIYPE